MNKAGLLLAAALLCAPYANAEQVKGVEVYPGAKADPSVSQTLAKKMNMKGVSTYRTSDSVKKVSEFYRKQGLTEIGTGTEQGAAFQKDKVTVTVQNPWLEMNSGQIMKDTLVSIAAGN